MTMNASFIKDLARRCGADLVGIASVERFANVPMSENPREIKPDTSSVIVLGFRILRGALRGIENGSNWGSFSASDPGGMCTYMQEATYHFCREIEENGYEALPLIRHSYDLRDRGVPVAPDRAAPDVIIDMELAAQQAGLGEMGMGKLFLTPEFGPRQEFTAVLTELELEADPIFRGHLCDHCGECAKACPALALDTKQITGRMPHWLLRYESCQICRTGTSPRPYSLGLEPNRVGAACGRACVRHLEEKTHSC